LALALESGKMDFIKKIYIDYFNFKIFQINDNVKDENIVIKSESSGFTSIVISPKNEIFKFVLLEPLNFESKSQIQDVINFFKFSLLIITMGLE
jgi:hypothetical protein